jgi:cytochrome P450
VRLPYPLQRLRFSMRQSSFFLQTQRRLGDTFMVRGVLDDWVTITSHPSHVRSLFTGSPELTPSLTGESPLRPIVGPNSVLTLLGARHMRQRKLLLPPFHGEAVERYVAMIEAAAEREIDSWPLHTQFALGPRMQAITLQVIMSGIFGVEGEPRQGSVEYQLREEIRRVVSASSSQLVLVAEMLLLRGKKRRSRIINSVMRRTDELLYELIAARRTEAAEHRGTPAGGSILSLLLTATDEQGQALTDEELRDELVTLVLAGHETTANSLAWAFERLLRNRSAYDRLRELVRAGDGHSPEADAYVEACIHEAMRVRPVIPSVGRRVTVPWRLGRYTVPAGTPIALSILLLHHREDVYPQPFAFTPERFLGVKPGTYTWIPFGGGIRRCLGATLAMAEQRVVLRAIARRTDMHAPELRPERMLHRNVTMVPAQGAQVLIDARS